MDWFKNKVEKPMLANGIVVMLRLVKVNNTLKKPGPVFNEMARAAYKAGASYFYRINDDTELLVNWPSIFTHAVGAHLNPFNSTQYLWAVLTCVCIIIRLVESSLRSRGAIV